MHQDSQTVATAGTAGHSAAQRTRQSPPRLQQRPVAEQQLPRALPARGAKACNQRVWRASRAARPRVCHAAARAHPATSALSVCSTAACEAAARSYSSCKKVGRQDTSGIYRSSAGVKPRASMQPATPAPGPACMGQRASHAMRLPASCAWPKRCARWRCTHAPGRPCKSRASRQQSGQTRASRAAAVLAPRRPSRANGLCSSQASAMQGAGSVQQPKLRPTKPGSSQRPTSCCAAEPGAQALWGPALPWTASQSYSGCPL